MSQEEMAHFLGVKVSNVSAWETMQNGATRKRMKGIADRLGVDVAYLAGETSYPPERAAPYLREEMNSIAKPLETHCREHLDDFLRRCHGDAAKLGWTLVELRRHFPLSEGMGGVSFSREEEEVVNRIVKEVLNRERGQREKFGAQPEEGSRPPGPGRKG